ncbi:MAG: hypothetical protein ABIS45_10905 [Burkholderiales bacterium]
MITARVLVLLSTMLTAGLAPAAELGRMFFTPAQRDTLDNARKQNIRVDIGTDEERPAAAAAQVPHNVSVNGMIRRSDGKNTIWLNNRVVSEQQPGGIGAAIRKNDNRVHLRVPDGGRNVDLKVGQTVEIVSGTIEENYLRRPSVKPEAKPPTGGENTGADVAKVTASAPGDAVKSEPPLQRRPVRAVDRDARDDTRNDNAADKK